METPFNLHWNHPSTKDFVCLTMETADGEGSLLQRLMGGSQIPSPTLPLFLNGDQMDILVLKLFSLGLILIQSLIQKMRFSGGNEAGIVGMGGTMVCSRGGWKLCGSWKTRSGWPFPLPHTHTEWTQAWKQGSWELVFRCNSACNISTVFPASKAWIPKSCSALTSCFDHHQLTLNL